MKGEGQQYTIDTLAEHTNAFGEAASKTSGELIEINKIFEEIKASISEGKEGDFVKPMKEIAGQLTAIAAKMAQDNVDAGIIDTSAAEND